MREVISGDLKNPDYFIAHLPMCANCSKKLKLNKTQFPNQWRGKCPDCGTEYIVHVEKRYHMRKVK
jgi:predicted RNA-binding Zn-ribbon protein involved in translation (DUF1610 family)